MYKRQGALSVIGAVSPAGGDISEPVSQATLRIVKVFWSLDSSLAYKRHFPAINWLTSYSLYVDNMAAWFNSHVHEDWMECRTRLMALLQDEAELQEIVQLVGMDALSAPAVSYTHLPLSFSLSCITNPQSAVLSPPGPVFALPFIIP